jgi:hypothetical protein
MSNAYDQLLAAARSVTEAALREDDECVSDAAAADYLAANHTALDAARAALQASCSATVEFTFAFFERYSPACCDLFKLGEAFDLAARHAERRNDCWQAARDGVAILDLANVLRRGGLVIGMLAGNVVEGLGLERLRRIHRRLDADDARRLAREVMRIDGEREPFDSITDRDEHWERAAAVPPESAGIDGIEWPDDAVSELGPGLVAAMQEISELPAFERRTLQRRVDDRGLALLRLLAIESALAAYYRDHGAQVRALAKLAPDQLPTLPVDPFSGEAFRYILSPEECLVYSPGPTGIDHGGLFGCWLDVEAGNADLCLAIGDFPCSVAD